MNSPSQEVSTPRYYDFKVPYLVDETFREGVERCLLTIEVEPMYRLFTEMVASGVREFVMGCGPEDPAFYQTVCRNKDDGTLPPEVQPVFLVLLNCWDATYENFKHMPRHWIENTVFSFGMIPHKKEERLFERVVNQFADLGARHLKASVLNNFSRGVDEQKYADIREQIDWAVSLGVRTIRINDSVGKLHPEVTAELCDSLVADYPDLTFCLHCHNDRGLALANQLTSIYHGFTMVEGSLCGYGNRAGMTPLEQLVSICQEKNIQLGEVPLDTARLCQAAQLAEETYMHIPDVYRPRSGVFVNKANFGVLNIPDFLGADGKRDYFLNMANLHPSTIRHALEQAGFDADKISDSRFIAQVLQTLGTAIAHKHAGYREQYQHLIRELLGWYAQSHLSSQDIVDIAASLVEDQAPLEGAAPVGD